MRGALLLCTIVTLVGCLGDPAPGAPDPTPTTATPSSAPSEILAVRDLDKGSFSPIGEDVREILRNASAWEALWARHRANESAPAVDFASEMVVAVVVHGPTGCGAMHIGDVSYAPADRIVRTVVVLEDPGPQVQCLVAFEDVYHFVAVPAREGSPLFVERTQRTFSAGSAGSGGPPTPEPEPAYVFRSIDKGADSGIRDERRVIVESIDEWRAFWDEHGSRQVPAPPLPSVDWTRERVFAAIAGERSNTCWAIEVTDVAEGEANVTVRVETTRPPSGMVCGQAIVSPYHFVSYPITDKALVVVEDDA